MAGKKQKVRVFEDTYTDFINSVKEVGYCTITDVCTLIKLMQSLEMDAHVVIAGQNGSGKTYLDLMLTKELSGNNFFEHYMLADKTTNDMVNYLLNNSNVPLGIDELNQYLYYKQHASEEQNHLMTMIELARSKCIAFIGCIRDPRKLTLNYRDGKMSIIIWIIDRYSDGSGAYAVVLVGNPALEGEDRFGISWLEIQTPDFEDMKSQMENLPSYIGYMKIPDAESLLTKEEISEYRSRKKVAMAYSHLNYVIKRFASNKIKRPELEEQLTTLRKVLGDEVIDSRIQTLKKSQTSLDEFFGGEDDE